MPSVWHETLTVRTMPSVWHKRVTARMMPSMWHETLTARTIPSVWHKRVTARMMPSVWHKILTARTIPSVWHETLTPRTMPSVWHRRVTVCLSEDDAIRVTQNTNHVDDAVCVTQSCCADSSQLLAMIWWPVFLVSTRTGGQIQTQTLARCID